MQVLSVISVVHQSVVMDLCQMFDQELEPLQIEMVQKEMIHPRKSYKINLSCVDILLFSAYKWNITWPSLVTDVCSFIHLFSQIELIWIFCIRIRMFWTAQRVTNIGSMSNSVGVTLTRMISSNIHTQSSWTMYVSCFVLISQLLTLSSPSGIRLDEHLPIPNGCMIGMDLAYNLWSAYGNWFPCMKPLIQQAMTKIMMANPACHVLREHI